MGEVVLAKDHDIERTVALKRLPGSTDLARVLRFVEEIRTVGQLEHPNIVPVHDVGVDAAGRYYFVMKHLQGETLESIIQRLAGRFAPCWAANAASRCGSRWSGGSTRPCPGSRPSWNTANGSSEQAPTRV